MPLGRCFCLLLASIVAGAGHLAAQIPQIRSIGREEFVSATYMEHPSVSTDSRCQPHMVADFGVGASFMKFHRVKGRWTGGVFATGTRGGRYDASRLYVGQIEIDALDRAWVSCKMGVKEFGDMYGQALWLFGDVDTNPYPKEELFRFVCVYKGMGAISTDAKYPNQGVMLGTFGNWEKINSSGQTLGKASLGLGNGGEKVRFRIASYAPRFDAPAGGNYPDGVWHTAMNGFSAVSSQYQNSLRYKAGLGPVTWAEYRSYSRMSDDYCHPGIGIDLDDPRICYMGSVYGSGSLCINVWDGNRLLFNPYSLKVLDFDATFGGREGVRFAPAPNGGTFVFWSSENVIKMCYLSQKGVSTKPRAITAGRSPGVTTDRNGNIHLVYYNNGIQYRKLLVSCLRPLKPADAVTATRTPAFKWTDTEAAKYTVLLTRDGVKQPAVTVNTNFWMPAEDLAVGSYSWRVKEGVAGSDSPWSDSLSFTVPPAAPVPVAPAGRLGSTRAPAFEWTARDPAATRYAIELFKDGDSLGLVKAAGVAKTAETLTADWTGRLGAGLYAWRMRSIRELDGYTVNSHWTARMEFQVLVPGPATITQPGSHDPFAPGNGTITCSWTPAEGAADYKLKLLFNGSLLDTVYNIAATNFAVTRSFQPGYHTLLVQPRNDSGNGEWSAPVTVLVPRLMRPANDATLDQEPGKLTWTRSRGADRYRAVVSQYNPKTGKYEQIRAKTIDQSAADADPVWHPGFDFPAGSYRWSVVDVVDGRPGYTSMAYFQVKVPGRPLLIAPGGPVTDLRNVPFRWSDPSGEATEFQIRVYSGSTLLRDPGWEPAASFRNGSEFSRLFSFSDSLSGALTWQVRGRNKRGTGPWRSMAFTLAATEKAP